MKILSSKLKTVLVATNSMDVIENCPRASITGAKAKFRDDFNGRVNARKGITKLLFSKL